MTEDKTLFADTPEGGIVGSVLGNKNKTKAVLLVKKKKRERINLSCQLSEMYSLTLVKQIFTPFMCTENNLMKAMKEIISMTHPLRPNTLWPLD